VASAGLQEQQQGSQPQDPVLQYWGQAKSVVVLALLILAGVLLLHCCVLAVAWWLAKRSMKRRVPRLLVFPVPEITVGSLALVPVVLAACALLAAQVDVGPGHKAAAVIGLVLMSALVLLVAAVVLALWRRHVQLGLEYVTVDVDG
jgi:hypothetical protein